MIKLARSPARLSQVGMIGLHTRLDGQDPPIEGIVTVKWTILATCKCIHKRINLLSVTDYPELVLLNAFLDAMSGKLQEAMSLSHHFIIH